MDSMVAGVVDKLQRLPGNADIPSNFWVELTVALSDSRFYYMLGHPTPELVELLAQEELDALRGKNKS